MAALWKMTPISIESPAMSAEGLQVELIGGLRRHELHRRPLHRLGDRLRIAEVVLLSLRVGPHVPRRHQPSIVTKRLKPATEMMRADAGFHADQARRHVCKSCFHLATRPTSAAARSRRADQAQCSRSSARYHLVEMAHNSRAQAARAGRGQGNATFLSRSPCRQGYYELAQLVE